MSQAAQRGSGLARLKAALRRPSSPDGGRPKPSKHLSACEHAQADADPTWNRREMLTLRRKTPAVSLRGRRHRQADGLGRVRIESGRCSDCAACIRICKGRALARRDEDRFVIYTLEASRCNGCGDCAPVCAEQALEVWRADAPGGLLEVARLPVSSCTRCRRQGAGFVDGLCVSCRQQLRVLGGGITGGERGLLR